MIDLNLKKMLPIIMTAVIFATTIIIASTKEAQSPAISNVNSNYDISDSTPDTINSDTEMRGVWITYMELSMENEEDKSEKRFREKFKEIVVNCKNFGFNTLIVQVRPFCDALYKSDYFPWSHILTGNQGENPNYDPLKIMCEICNTYNLEIHAWINPYRVSLNETPSEFSNDNPYVADNSIAIETKSGIILDPSSEKARKLIVDGVLEIIRNYDIDAIQFDDYFYPTDIEDNDSTQYSNYVELIGESNSMNIDYWREANVNMLVCEVYKAIHLESDTVKFGISPQGNIDNNKKLYADVKSWCSCRGFVDYICPQIYFSLENPSLTFEDSLKSWTSLEYDDKVDLYVGLAGYKAGSDKDSGTWLESDEILAQEYDIIKNNETVKGFMLYSYSSILDDTSQYEIANLKDKLN